MYGAPSDVKIKKISQSTSGIAVYLVSFTTLTPAMRESNRKAYISASVVGNGLFMLITTTTATRFKKLDDTLRSVADSFSAIPAPKSSLRKVSWLLLLCLTCVKWNKSRDSKNVSVLHQMHFSNLFYIGIYILHNVVSLQQSHHRLNGWRYH